MMKTLSTTALMSAALIIPVPLAPIQLRAADQKYHDKGHNLGSISALQSLTAVSFGYAG
jgi:hypothetical protein